MTNPTTPPPPTNEELRKSSPPYFRFPLHGRHNQRRRLPTSCRGTTRIASASDTLPELPTFLEQAGIVQLEWSAFWHEMQALLFAHQAQRLEWHGTGLCVLVTLLWLHHVIYGLRYYAVDMPPMDEWSWSVVLIGLASVVGPFLLFVLYHRRQHALFTAIQSYCQKSSKSTAAGAFDRHGFNVTCELVPTANDGHQLYLYIVPVDMPYARFEVYQTCRGSHNGDCHFMDTGHGGDKVESCVRGTTKCPNVPILPADLRERLPLLRDWNDFWCDMKMVTQAVDENGLQCDQTFWILLAVCAVLSVVMVVTMLDDVPLSILALLAFVSLTTYPFLYIVYRWYACVWSQVTLVHKYSKRFSPQGVFVEHRRIVSFHPWLGPYERHYVDMYVAPPPPPSCGSEWTLVNDTDTDTDIK